MLSEQLQRAGPQPATTVLSYLLYSVNPPEGRNTGITHQGNRNLCTASGASSANKFGHSVDFSNVISMRRAGAHYTFLNAWIPESNSRRSGVEAAPGRACHLINLRLQVCLWSPGSLGHSQFRFPPRPQSLSSASENHLERRQRDLESAPWSPLERYLWKAFLPRAVNIGSQWFFQKKKPTFLCHTAFWFHPPGQSSPYPHFGM